MSKAEEFTKRRINGDRFRDIVLDYLKTNIREYSFCLNPETDDSFEGDILVYSRNGAFIAGIDCKNSEYIAVSSIAKFYGANTIFGQRALYLSPWALVIQSDELVNYVFEKIYKEYSELNLRIAKHSEAYRFLNIYIDNKEVNSNFFVKMQSGYLGVRIDALPAEFKLIDNIHWQNEEYLRTLRKFIKNKNTITLRKPS